jgi:hypothetical protein
MAYVVTQTGPTSFQVAATDKGANVLIADFASQEEAETFATTMRQIDSGFTTSMAHEKPC